MEASFVVGVSWMQGCVIVRFCFGRAWRLIWDFPKIRGTLFWRPYNKDPTSWGTILGFPIFGNPHFRFCNAKKVAAFSLRS